MPSDWFNKKTKWPIARQEEVRWIIHGQRTLGRRKIESHQLVTEEAVQAVRRDEAMRHVTECRLK